MRLPFCPWCRSMPKTWPTSGCLVCGRCYNMEISCSQVQNLVISLYSSATQLSSHWEQIYLVNKMLVLLTKKKIQIKLLVLFEFCKKASHFAFIWNSPRCWADLLTPQSRKAPSRASSSVLITEPSQVLKIKKMLRKHCTAGPRMRGPPQIQSHMLFKGHRL